MPEPAPRDRAILAGSAIFAVALMTRAWWAASGPLLDGDAAEYLRLGRVLAANHVFALDGVTPTAYRPPVYPAMIALSTMLTTHAVALVLLLQVVAGASSAVLSWLVAREWFEPRVALWAGLAMALAPMNAYFVRLLLTETLFTFLLLLAVLAWARDRPVAAGLTLGAATLTRALLLPYLAFLLVASVIPAFAVRRRQIAIVAAVAAMVVAPWVIRNGLATGQWTISAGEWGESLLCGTVELHKGSNPWIQVAEQTGYPRVRGAEATRLAMTRISGDPAGWVRARFTQYPLLLIDSGSFLPIAPNAYSFGQALRERRWATIALKAAFVVGNGILLCLAIAGAWQQRRRLVELLPLWSFPVFVLAAQVPMWVESRYGLPLEPFMAVFAASAVTAMAVPLRAHVPAPSART